MWTRWDTVFWAVFHGVHALCDSAAFERGRTDLPERRMPSPLVVKNQVQEPVRDQVMTVHRLRIERADELDDLGIDQEPLPASRFPRLSARYGLKSQQIHVAMRSWARRLRQRLGRRQLMAGFAVSINGWIWVSTEAIVYRRLDPRSIHAQWRDRSSCSSPIRAVCARHITRPRSDEQSCTTWAAVSPICISWRD